MSTTQTTPPPRTSQPPPPRAQSEQDSGGGWMLIIAVIAVVAFTFPALLLAIPCYVLLKRSYYLGMGLAIAGILLFGTVCSTRFGVEAAATKHDFKAAKRGGGLGAGLERVGSHLPMFWLLTLPLAPAAGLVFDLVRPRKIDEKLAQADQFRQQRARRAERAEATRGRALAVKRRNEPEAPVVAAVLKGEPLVDFEVAGDYLLIRTQQSVANLHMLLLAGSGAGKTVTILRILSTFAATTDYPIFFINPKNDQETKDAFYTLMLHHGRTPRLYPDEAYNGWQGDRTAVHNRLLTIPNYGTEGGSAYYTEMSEEYLWLALEAAETTPQTFDELVAGLAYETIAERLEQQKNLPALRRLGRIKPDDALSITMRLSNMARKLDTLRADGWSLDTTDAGYFGLNVLGAQRDIDATIKFLLEDVKHYFAVRKNSKQRVVLAIDEFGALGTDTVITLMEMIRSLGGILILATQTQDSLGDPMQQRRILGNVTTILQQMNQPEELAKLGGTVDLLQPRFSVEKSHIDTYGESSAMRKTVLRVDPNEVQRLEPGQAFIINKGRMCKIQVIQPPEAMTLQAREEARGIYRDDEGMIELAEPEDILRLSAQFPATWRTLDPVTVLYTLTQPPAAPPAAPPALPAPSATVAATPATAEPATIPPSEPPSQQGASDESGPSAGPSAVDDAPSY